MFALILIALLASAQAQPARSVSVSGIVQDQTKAILPNAQVVLLVSGNESPVQTGVTDGTGTFRFDQVAPGDYSVRAEFPGFKAVAVKVRVGARAPAPVTIVLPLEGLSQEIAVSGSGVNVAADARSNLNAITVDA